MRDDQEHEKQTLAMLSGLRATWKKALLGLPLFIAFTLFYFYGMNMVTTPWAYHLTPTTPQGNWIGALPLAANQSYLVKMEMAHDTVFSDTQSNTIPELSGQISICPASGAIPGAIAASTVWGNPNWIGSSVVLGTKIDFGNGTVPKKIICQAKKDALDCTFDFEHPISRASKKFREEFKNVYTAKAEFKAKIPVKFVPLKKDDRSFADQCKDRVR